MKTAQILYENVKAKIDEEITNALSTFLELRISNPEEANASHMIAVGLEMADNALDLAMEELSKQPENTKEVEDPQKDLEKTRKKRLELKVGDKVKIARHAGGGEGEIVGIEGPDMDGDVFYVVEKTTALIAYDRINLTLVESEDEEGAEDEKV